MLLKENPIIKDCMEISTKSKHHTDITLKFYNSDWEIAKTMRDIIDSIYEITPKEKYDSKRFTLSLKYFKNHTRFYIRVPYYLKEEVLELVVSLLDTYSIEHNIQVSAFSIECILKSIERDCNPHPSTINKLRALSERNK